MQYEEITSKIIGAAYQVHSQLGFGFLESVYKKSLLIELSKQGLHVSSEVGMSVYYDEQVVGDFFADIVVDNDIIIELKTVQKLTPIHEAQIVNYLVATKKDIGLLINFGPEKVEVKRKYRTYTKTQ